MPERIPRVARRGLADRRGFSGALVRERRFGWGACLGSVGIGLLCLLMPDSRAADVDRAAALEFFENRIRPVLVESCYECHSAKASSIKGGFTLDSRDGIRRGGESGRPSVVPHDPEMSGLLKAIRRHDPDLAMPPKKALPAQVVADFEAWIRAGAVDPRDQAAGTPAGQAKDLAARHWAFTPPKKAEPPSVRESSWVRTPIDAFVLHRLELQGLRPAARADRRTLLRRLSFTLWGLPPDPTEVEAFALDPAPDAWERRVDRMLASPRYGERWGRHWLDVARYADTKGYVYYYEESRFVHPHTYRDWVIRALNEDMPYDRFLALQIAGDQLVPAREDSVDRPTVQAATLRWPTPVFDRDVAALGFLTLGRRFLDLSPDIIDDRIDVLMRGTQGLTVGCARCHDHKFDPIPTRDYYSLYGVFQGSEEQLVALGPSGAASSGAEASARESYERGTRERVEALEQKFRAACDQVDERHRSRVKDYLVAALDVARLPSDANVRPQPEDINPYHVRQWDRFLAARIAAGDPVFVPWRAFAALPVDAFGVRARAVSAELMRRPATEVHPAVRPVFAPPPASMREVAERYGDLFLAVHERWKQVLSGAVAGAPLPDRLPDPNAEALRQVLHGPSSPVRVPAGSIVELDVHLYFDDPNRVALATLQMQLEQWVMTNAAAPLHAVVLRDRVEQVAPAVFRRGDPSKRGENVPRQFLEVLSKGEPRRPFEHGSGRLELARAITDRRNPLTARVLVNRVWAQHFGEGLVRTPSDFGVRGEAPTHPELLDWLACWFEEHGQSLKALHRLILNSAVFQQSSEPSAPEVLERDPDNRLLAHGSRRRLDFESFRDALLVACGELDERRGGPGVELHKAPFSRRRSVYGYVDRRSVPGMLQAFNFANPDMHSPRRHATTAPQQALFLMNHPFVTERARALVGRLNEGGGETTAARLERLYRWALQRGPTPREMEEAREFLASSERESASPAELPVAAGSGAAGALLGPWEELAQVILLSNEFSFVD